MFVKLKKKVKKLLDNSIQDYELGSSTSLFEKIKELECRIEVLEQENISSTNELYRMENSLDARIDILYNEVTKINRK